MKQRDRSRRRRLSRLEGLESRHLLTAIGSINSGIAVDDDATGVGYLMFSQQDVHTRFSPAPALGNSDHLIAVRYQSGNWQFNDNFDWYNFSPTATDRLLAEVDFGADTLSSFECVEGTIHNIDHGFASDNLEFFANIWNEEFNSGEFSITGTSFETSWTECASVLSISPDTNAQDLVTSATNLTIHGRFEPQIDLEVDVDGTVYTVADAELTTSGADWSLDLTGTTLTEGDHFVSISVNGQPDVGADKIVVDSSPPFVFIDELDPDNGVNNSDFVTTERRVSLSGRYERGTDLVVSVGDLSYRLNENPQLRSDATDEWTLDLTSVPLAGGFHLVTATSTDLAGNSVSATQNVQVVTASIDKVTDDTGPTDFITADGTLAISGSFTPGATLTLDIDGASPSFADLLGLSPTTVSGDKWTLDLTGTTLPQDSYSITANVDLAGNTTSTSQDLLITDQCYYVDSFELRDPNNNSISSLATVTLDHAGSPTVAINLEARKTPTNNVFYVDETAVGPGTGSMGDPFDDIATAFDQIEILGLPDATIHVEKGTYVWGYQNNLKFDLNIIGKGIGETIVRYDSLAGTDPANSNNTYTAQFRRNSTYIEGITFDGDDDANPNTPTDSFIVMDVRNADALTIVDSEFKNGGKGDGLNVFDTTTVVVYDSTAHDNYQDGFSYSNPNGRAMEVFEAFAMGSNNGKNGLWNSQGSTVHESVNIVRVGGIFEGNPTNISDVTNGTSWNVDVTTANALTNEQADQYLNFNISGGGTAWIVGGDHSRGLPTNRPTVVNAQPGSEIRYVGAFDTLDPVTTVVSGNIVEDNQVLVGNSVPCVASVSIDLIDLDTGDPTDFVTHDGELIITGSFVGTDVSVTFDGTTYTSASTELTIDGFDWSLDLTDSPLLDGTYNVSATATDGNGGSDTASRVITVACDPTLHALVDNPVLQATDATLTVDENGRANVAIDLEARKPASTNIFYVDSEAVVANPTGSATDPFGDLPDAFEHIKLNGLSDAVIHLAAGDYTWGDAINPDNEPTNGPFFKASLTVIGAGPTLTKIHQGSSDLAAGVFSEGGESLYVEGIQFIGLGDAGLPNINEHAFEATAGDELTFVDTIFTDASDGDGLFVAAFGNVVVYESIAIRNDSDGFSYTKTSDGSSPMNVLEVGVIAAGNGTNGEASSQGSTMHRDTNILRANSTYANNPTNIEDTGLESWNVNLEVKNPTVFQNRAGGAYVNILTRGDKHEATNGRTWLISGNYHEGGLVHARATTANNSTPIVGEIRYTDLFDIGSHPEGTVLTADQPGLIALDSNEITPLPAVESVTVNDGARQRSMVRELTITFYDEVAIDSGAFSIDRDFNGTIGSFVVPDMDVATSVVDGKTVVVISFDNTPTNVGVDIRGRSLPNGNYTLTVDSSKVHACSVNLTSDHVESFFRFFGDVDGDRTVEGLDLFSFRRTYRRQSHNSGFNDAFDVENDGDVDGIDLFAFRRNYRRTLAPP